MEKINDADRNQHTYIEYNVGDAVHIAMAADDSTVRGMVDRPGAL